MKLITEKTVQLLEEKYDCIVLSDRYDLTMSIMWTLEEDYQIALKEITKDKIPFVVNNTSKRTIFVKQEDLPDFFPMSEERVWLSSKKQKATPVAEMDHQRLSNCVHLLDLMLRKGEFLK